MQLSTFMKHLSEFAADHGDPEVMVVNPDYGDFRLCTRVEVRDVFPVDDEVTRFDTGGKPKGPRFAAIVLR